MSREIRPGWAADDDRDPGPRWELVDGKVWWMYRGGEYQSERRDGPRYVEAVRGAREMRSLQTSAWNPSGRPLPALRVEILSGVPVGWWRRP